MTSPLLELQGVIVNRLRTDAKVAALVSARVYDRVQKDVQYPFISYGDVSAQTDDADCIPGLDTQVLIHVWSQKPGKPEALTITDAVYRSLHDADLSLADNAIVMFEHVQSDPMLDPDGLTTHVVMRFNSFIEVKG